MRSEDPREVIHSFTDAFTLTLIPLGPVLDPVGNRYAFAARPEAARSRKQARTAAGEFAGLSGICALLCQTPLPDPGNVLPALRIAGAIAVASGAFVMLDGRPAQAFPATPAAVGLVVARSAGVDGAPATAGILGACVA